MFNKRFRLYLLTLLFYSSVSVQCLDRIAIITVPKSGTHLLHKAIHLLTGLNAPVQWKVADLKLKQSNKNQFIIGHFPCLYNNQNKITHSKAIFIYRDPRDMLVSAAFWRLRNSKLAQRIDINTLISTYIQNFNAFHPASRRPEIKSAYANIDTAYRQAYLPWRQCPNVYTTTFERLVGSKGGGSDKLQLRELRRIAQHIGAKKTINDLKRIAHNLFGNTFTFKNGQIGSWKKYFNEKNKKDFKRIAGQLLIDLGYEQDFNW